MLDAVKDCHDQEVLSNLLDSCVAKGDPEHPCR